MPRLTNARPIVVHFGGELADPALITATDKRSHTVYAVGASFGLWMADHQEGDDSQPVWFERCAPTAEHEAIAGFHSLSIKETA
jgi:hypothetical protein